MVSDGKNTSLSILYVKSISILKLHTFLKAFGKVHYFFSW